MLRNLLESVSGAISTHYVAAIVSYSLWHFLRPHGQACRAFEKEIVGDRGKVVN